MTNNSRVARFKKMEHHIMTEHMPSAMKDGKKQAVFIFKTMMGFPTHNKPNDFVCLACGKWASDMNE